MADVFERAYTDRNELLADLKNALASEGFSESDAEALCVEVGNSRLITEGSGIVGYQLPRSRSGNMGFLVQVPIYDKALVFNGKKALMKLFLSAVGGVIGGPIAVVAVLQNLVGYDFALLEYDSGMVCNLTTMLEANTPMSPSYLAEITSGKDCARPNSVCERRQNGKCVISTENVQDNLTRMEERKAVRSTGSDTFVANVL